MVEFDSILHFDFVFPVGMAFPSLLSKDDSIFILQKKLTMTYLSSYKSQFLEMA